MTNPNLSHAIQRLISSHCIFEEKLKTQKLSPKSLNYSLWWERLGRAGRLTLPTIGNCNGIFFSPNLAIVYGQKIIEIDREHNSQGLTCWVEDQQGNQIWHSTKDLA